MPDKIADQGATTFFNAVASLPAGIQVAILTLMAMAFVSIALNAYLIKVIARYAPVLAVAISDAANAIKSLEDWLKAAMK